MTTRDKNKKEIERLNDHVTRLDKRISRLHAECRKYRLALNRVAHPDSWGINPGYGREIARRSLLIGVEVDPLPQGAAIPRPKPDTNIEPGPWARKPKPNQP